MKTDNMNVFWNWFVALGIVSLILGFMAVAEAAWITIATTFIIGAILVAMGIVQILHYFAIRKWDQNFWSVIAGSIYIIGGILLMTSPMDGSIAITLLIGACLIASGLTRLVIAFRSRHFQSNIWWFLVASVISIALGLLLFITLPWSAIWLLGTIIGIELIIAGLGWIQFGLMLNFTSQKKK